MSKLYRLIVFDWEGTLGDTLGQIFHHIALEAERLKLGKFDDITARQSMDLGLAMMLKKIFPQLQENQYEQLIYGVHQGLNTKSCQVFLIPGAKEFVSELYDKGINLAIATNKGQQSLQRALHASGLDSFFKVTRSAGQTAPKPCPEMLEEIINEFHDIEPSQTLMIGDSETDIEMANSLNIDAIGMDFYHQQKDVLLEAGALAVFDNYFDLAKHLQLPNLREPL